MFKKIAAALVLVLLGLSMAFSVYAWDETGHKITGYIAWQQMTPEVRENVIKVLLAAPEDAQLSTFFLGSRTSDAPYGPRSNEALKREFFMFVATWGDVVRDRIFETRYKKYNNSNWHYHDTLWTTKNGKVEYIASTEELGKMMEKIGDFDKLIRNPTATPAEKAIAVAWLMHLIGDMHQPLHTTGRVIFGEEDKGDQGGNLFSLTPKGTPRDKSLNLHSFWDGIIKQTTPNTTDACEADYLYPIAQAIMKEFPYSSLEKRIANDQFQVWEKEGVDLSVNEVYKGLTRYEMPSDDYKKKALKIGKERLALAGYRMGNLFNEVFKTPAITPTATPTPSAK